MAKYHSVYPYYVNETRFSQESATSVKSEAFLVDTSNKKINFIETVWLIHANILC